MPALKNLVANPTTRRAIAGSTVIRRNLIQDPRFNSYAGSTDGYGSGGAGVVERLANGGADGGAFARMRWTTAATGGGATFGSGVANNPLTDPRSNPVTPGRRVTFSIDARVNQTTASGRLALTLHYWKADGSAGPALTFPMSTIAINKWERFQQSVLIPAGVSRVRVGVRILDLSGTAADLMLDIGRPLAEEIPAPALPYFDGGSASDDTGIAYSWEGVANSSASVAKASVLEVRRNYAVSPMGIGRMLRYQATESQTITENVPVSDHPLGISTANRVDYTIAAAGSNPGVQFTVGAPIPRDVTIVASAWVKVLTTQRTEGYALAIATQTAETSRTLQVGVWTYVTWTVATTSLGRDVGFRHSTANPGDYSFLITGMQVEIATAPQPGLFDGNTTPDANLIPSWTGTPEQSPSILSGVRPDGYAYSTVKPYIAPGRGIAVMPRDGFNTDSYASVRVPTTVGKTYTVMGFIELTAVQSSPIHGRARQFRVFSPTDLTMTTLLRPPNAVGVHEARETFIAGTADTEVRFYNGTQLSELSNIPVFWRRLLVVEGVYQGPYFDGDSLNASWDGVRNLSTSSKQFPALSVWDAAKKEERWLDLQLI